MRINTRYTFLAILFLLFNACSKNSVDTEAPKMEVIEYKPAPIKDSICGGLEPNVFVLEGGDYLSFEVLFSDNEGLSQYKVDIHNNFDCHGHGGGSAPSISVPNVENQTIDWSILEIKELSGISDSIKSKLLVPENITAGNYHFHIQVIDESGNDSPFANFFSLKITNPIDIKPPKISITKPNTSNLIVKKGSSINFKGTVTDDRSLSDGGNGVLYLAFTDLSSGNTFNTNSVYSFDENINQKFDFDFEYTIPSTLKTGMYRFSLGANDGVRNVAPFQFFDVTITN